MIDRVDSARLEQERRDEFSAWAEHEFSAYRDGGPDNLDKVLVAAKKFGLGEDHIDTLTEAIVKVRRERVGAPRRGFRRDGGYRHADPGPKIEDLIAKASEEPHAEGPDAEAWADAEFDAEAAFVEDAADAANNTRLRIERLSEALEHVPWDPAMGRKVAGVLWRISEGARDAALTALVKWWHDQKVDENANRGVWDSAPGAPFVRIEEIYAVAQRRGWRFTVAQNLNRLHEVTERTEAALLRAGAEIYQSSGRLVRVVTGEVDATKGRKTRVARLLPIEPPFLKGEVARYVDFFSWERNGKERKPIGPPPDVIAGLLARFGEWGFRAVNGVICSPTLRRDGSVLATPGLDPASGLFVVGPLPAMRRVDAKPTRADALEALGILKDLLVEFPFVTGACKSAALSGMISPVVRGALTCVPMHAATAPSPGTGKSYLHDVSSGIAMGDAMPIMAAGKDEEELEKRLGSHILKGISLLSIDNVSGPMGGEALCQAIERPTLSIRILAKSQMPEKRNNWGLYASGNNLRLRDDITRRVLLSRLDRGDERPELWRFKGNPFEAVLRDRGRYLWACLTIVLAYKAAGQPERLPWFGDPFGEWSDLVRSALVWLGMDDPVMTMEAVRDADPARQARVAMWAAMQNAYGTEPRFANEMCADAKTGRIKRPKDSALSTLDQPAGESAEGIALRNAIIGYTNDRLDPKYLGNKFNTDKSKIAGGLRLCSQYDSHHKTNRWFVSPLTAGSA
jgi:putative DNA primase/helicase